VRVVTHGFRLVILARWRISVAEGEKCAYYTALRQHTRYANAQERVLSSQTTGLSSQGTLTCVWYMLNGGNARDDTHRQHRVRNTGDCRVLLRVWRAAIQLSLSPRSCSQGCLHHPVRFRLHGGDPAHPLEHSQRLCASLIPARQRSMVNGQRAMNTSERAAPTSYRLSPLSTKACITPTPRSMIALCQPRRPVMAMKPIPGITGFTPGEDSLRKKDMKNSSRRRGVDNVDNSKNHRGQKENRPANSVGKLSTYPQGRWITRRNAGGTWTATRPLRCPST